MTEATPSLDKPLVSVVMTVYNDGPYVAEAVKSILRQTFTDFEFIIVDDGAIDDSVAKVQAFDDPRIRLIRQPNSGLAAALNRGIREARGELIARQDADDVSELTRLERQVTFIGQHSEVGLAGSNARVVDENNRVIRATEHPLENSILQQQLVETGNTFTHGSVMFRKSVAMQVGLYRPEFERCQDYDLWLRMAEVTQVANLPDVLYCWRHRRASVGARHWVRNSDFARLARWCAIERRKGRPEPELDVRGATREWFTSLTERLRVVKDPGLVYEFMNAQHLVLQGQGAEARPILARLIRSSPLTLYAWLLLLLTYLPSAAARSLWHRLRSVYRAATWKH